MAPIQGYVTSALTIADENATDWEALRADGLLLSAIATTIRQRVAVQMLRAAIVMMQVHRAVVGLQSAFLGAD